jgi:hypothetical protein
MKKTSNAEIAIAAALVVTLAAMGAILYQPSLAGTGQLAIMGTDPAIAASGVSDSSVHYSSVSAHRAGSDMSSGWTQVSGSGTLDLMASGSAQTMATSQVSAGTYDAFRFNVDSCKVVYQGQEYAATVASSTITAESQSRVLVNSSSTATAVAIVDMRTFIMNTGNTSKPQFFFSASAVATSVPSSAFVSASLQLGTTASLSGSWWTDFVAKSSTQVAVTGSVSSNSIVLSIHNTGSADAQAQEVVVTPASAWAYASASLPASYSGSAVFTVDGAGSLQSTTYVQSAAVLSGGASVASGSSATLTYNGNISMDFGAGTATFTGVVPGQQYIVTVIGANTYASALVVAS